jgi:hypothetical protein
MNMTTTYASINRIARYVGRCKTCKTVFVNETDATETCCSGKRVRVEQILAVVSNVKCGARCTNAVGPSCDCSCGGANHSSGH